MADIQVFFERHGGSPNLKVIVLNARQPVLEDEGVHWHFQAEDPRDLDEVEIEFEDPKAKYFHTATPPNKFRRALAEGDTIYGRPPEDRKPQDPVPGEGNQVRMHGYKDKYWIRGYKAGKVVAFLDPEIVPIRPPS